MMIGIVATRITPFVRRITVLPNHVTTWRRVAPCRVIVVSLDSLGGVCANLAWQLGPTVATFGVAFRTIPPDGVYHRQW
eukprot:scaffold42680_cov206-Amphora_coffeaeformis.AAC.2